MTANAQNRPLRTSPLAGNFPTHARTRHLPIPTPTPPNRHAGENSPILNKTQHHPGPAKSAPQTTQTQPAEPATLQRLRTPASRPNRKRPNPQQNSTSPRPAKISSQSHPSTQPGNPYKTRETRGKKTPQPKPSRPSPPCGEKSTTPAPNSSHRAQVFHFTLFTSHSALPRSGPGTPPQVALLETENLKLPTPAKRAGTSLLTSPWPPP